MRELYDLKEMLINELKEYGSKDELSAGTLDIVDKLAHATKNLCKVIEDYEEAGHSNRNSYEGSYEGRGGSYRGRRRDSMGRYARDGYARDGYSRDGELKEELRMLANDATDERVRQEIMKLISKLDVG